MREAVQDWRDLASIRETYEALSLRRVGHTTPKKHNACAKRAQLASCLLICIKGDSIDGIYATLADCAKNSKHGAGLGISIHDIRGAGSRIEGTDGVSNGLVPMLKVFEVSFAHGPPNAPR
jgi:ribonucleotide reductase alpha subunit